jgi:hypothetical protein
MTDIQDPHRRLEKLLEAYEQCYDYRPVECNVCGEWNLCSNPVQWECTRCGKKVCRRDWVNKKSGGLCADCDADL